MTQTPAPLQAWLADSKGAFLTDLKNDAKSLDEWVVVMGNEAGDLDSIAAAIGFAYLSSTSAQSISKRFVPLVQSAFDDLHLRPENVEVLNDCHLAASSILFIGDLTSPSQLAARGASFSLVDHNRLLPLFLPPTLAEADAKVLSIIDHHVDEGSHPLASPRVIELVGSSSSLVASQFPTAELPADLSSLLLSAILIDTSLKLTTQGGKATPVDLSAVARLEPSVAPSSFFSDPSSHSPPPGLADIAKRLNKLKDDVSHLSGRDLIRRDYKAYTVATWSYGIGTVPISLTSAWLSNKDHASSSQGWSAIEKDMSDWVNEQNLDMLIVATTFSFKPSGLHSKLEDTLDRVLHKRKDGGTKKQHTRELVVLLAPGKQAELSPLFALLEKDSTIKLVPWKAAEVGASHEAQAPHVHDGNWRVWRQENDRASRKQIAPIVKGALEELAGQAKL